MWRDFMAFLLLLFSSNIIESKAPRPNLKELRLFMVLGFGGMFVNQLTYIYGLFDTSPANANIWQNASPVITTCIASSLGMEQFNKSKVLGIFITLVGAFIIIFHKDHETEHAANKWFQGNLYLICAVCSFSVYV
eukprot:UN29893